MARGGRNDRCDRSYYTVVVGERYRRYAKGDDTVVSGMLGGIST